MKQIHHVQIMKKKTKEHLNNSRYVNDRTRNTYLLSKKVYVILGGLNLIVKKIKYIRYMVIFSLYVILKKKVPKKTFMEH